ncbi:enolase-phosphatase E1 [Lepisosteus oculatus]|uniref:enolase-phosphatase E1 n=1 Tax=Lepisosteus oculatus TaxID=7918 RepID=UPI0037239F6E
MDNKLQSLGRASPKLRYFPQKNERFETIQKGGGDMHVLDDVFEDSDSSPLSFCDMNMPSPVPKSSSTPRCLDKKLILLSQQKSESQYQIPVSHEDSAVVQKTSQNRASPLKGQGSLQMESSSQVACETDLSRESDISAVIEIEVGTLEKIPSTTEAEGMSMCCRKLPEEENAQKSFSSNNDEFESLAKKKAENPLCVPSHETHSSDEEPKKMTSSDDECALLNPSPSPKELKITDALPHEKWKKSLLDVEKQPKNSPIATTSIPKKANETSSFLQKLKNRGRSELLRTKKKESPMKDPPLPELDEDFMILEEENFKWENWISIPKKKCTSSNQPQHDINENVKKKTAKEAEPSKTSAKSPKNEHNIVNVTAGENKRKEDRGKQSQKKKTKENSKKKQTNNFVKENTHVDADVVQNKKKEAQRTQSRKKRIKDSSSKKQENDYFDEDAQVQDKIKTAPKAKEAKKRKLSTEAPVPVKAKIKFTDARRNTMGTETQTNKSLNKDGDLNDHCPSYSSETEDAVIKPVKQKSKDSKGMCRSAKVTQEELLKKNIKTEKKALIGVLTSPEQIHLKPAHEKRQCKPPQPWWLMGQEESINVNLNRNGVKEATLKKHKSKQTEVLQASEAQTVMKKQHTRNTRHKVSNSTEAKAKKTTRQRKKTNTEPISDILKPSEHELKMHVRVQHEGDGQEISDAYINEEDHSISPLHSSCPNLSKAPLGKKIISDAQQLKVNTRKGKKAKPKQPRKTQSKLSKTRSNYKAAASLAMEICEEQTNSVNEEEALSSTSPPLSSRTKELASTPERTFPGHAIISEDPSEEHSLPERHILKTLSTIQKQLEIPRGGYFSSPVHQKRQRKPPGNWWEPKDPGQPGSSAAKPSRKQASILKRSSVNKCMERRANNVNLKKVCSGEERKDCNTLSDTVSGPTAANFKPKHSKIKQPIIADYLNGPRNLRASLASFDAICTPLNVPQRLTPRTKESTVPRAASEKKNKILCKQKSKKTYFSPSQTDQISSAAPKSFQVHQHSKGHTQCQPVPNTQEMLGGFLPLADYHQDGVSPLRDFPASELKLNCVSIPEFCPVSEEHVSVEAQGANEEMLSSIPSDQAHHFREAQPSVSYIGKQQKRRSSLQHLRIGRHSGCASYQGYESGPSSMRTIHYEDDVLVDCEQENSFLAGKKSCLQVSENPASGMSLNQMELTTAEKERIYLWLKKSWTTTITCFAESVVLDDFDWYESSGKFVGLVKNVKCPLFSQGKILLGPFMKKNSQLVVSDAMIFNVLAGTVHVKIDLQEQNLSSGDVFCISPGQMYSVLNMCEEPALLLYTQMKYSKTNNMEGC